MKKIKNPFTAESRIKRLGKKAQKAQAKKDYRTIVALKRQDSKINKAKRKSELIRNAYAPLQNGEELKPIMIKPNMGRMIKPMAKFPDLSGDGKVTQKDILMGRGVIDKPKLTQKQKNVATKVRKKVSKIQDRYEKETGGNQAVTESSSKKAKRLDKKEQAVKARGMKKFKKAAMIKPKLKYKK